MPSREDPREDWRKSICRVSRLFFLAVVVEWVFFSIAADQQDFHRTGPWVITGHQRSQHLPRRHRGKADAGPKTVPTLIAIIIVFHDRQDGENEREKQRKIRST